MTYRDTEDALRARIQALESRLSQRSREQVELREELARARQDLAALHPPQQKRPTTLLTLGLVGAALVLFGLVAVMLVPWIGYNPQLTFPLFVIGDLGLELRRPLALSR